MGKKLGRVVLAVIGTGVVVSMWVDLTKQWGNLITAYKKSMENEAEIAKLTEENIEYVEKIKYSTSSAYIEQQAREKLGLGGENDYWLELEEEDKTIDLYPEIREENRRTAWRQWWELFNK